MLVVENVLSPQEVVDISQCLKAVEFQDGKTTAGWHSRLVKNNEQASVANQNMSDVQDKILGAIQRNQIVRMACIPYRFTPITISRYRKGMEYGLHVDDPIHFSQPIVRADVSFTLFLNDPESYDGGELMTRANNATLSAKLKAGSGVFYPSGSVHKVQPVQSGQRLAAIGWIQSMVRSAEKREILFDLDTSARQLFEKEGKTDVFDTLAKTAANLLRMWSEV